MRRTLGTWGTVLVTLKSFELIGWSWPAVLTPWAVVVALTIFVAALES